MAHRYDNQSAFGFNTFMEKFDPTDISRDGYPADISFTWSNKTGSRQSRIDFWLISKCIDSECVTSNICTTPLTDHRAIYIHIKIFTPDTNFGRASYLKLNSSLLNNDMVNFEVKDLLSHVWERACEEKSYYKKWELFKFEVSKYLRKYGSNLAKTRRAEEEKVIIKITSLSPGGGGEDGTN